MHPKITVVTPSYNQVHFLEETLRSVLSQRDQIHEYFVLDGGSTDGSADLIRKYADKGIDWWVSEKDRGQSDAIRRGFARATGDVICWLNSDDLFLPNAIKLVREAFHRNPKWDVLTGYHVQIDAESRLLAFYPTPRETRLKYRWGVLRVCQQTCFFKRDLYERVGGLDIGLHFAMDFDLWLKFFAAGAVWGHVPHYTAAFRWYAAAKSSAGAQKMSAEGDRIRERFPQFFPTFSQRMAENIYRVSQLIKGTRPLASIRTARYRGQPFNRVMGIADPQILGDGPRTAIDDPSTRI